MPTSEQLQNNPLIVPDIDVENSGGNDVSTNTSYGDLRVKEVTVGAGQVNVQLPNGFAYNAGDVVALTQWEFDQIATAVFSQGILTDTT
jgi:hypothetical protein